MGQCETFAYKKLVVVTTEDIVDFINSRLTEGTPATVGRDVDMLSQVINYVSEVWKIAASENLLVRRQAAEYFYEREQRLKTGEEQHMLDAARADENSYSSPSSSSPSQRQRRSEILALSGSKVSEFG